MSALNNGIEILHKYTSVIIYCYTELSCVCCDHLFVFHMFFGIYLLLQFLL